MCPQGPKALSHTSQYPYPCIGAYRFLDLSIMSSPHYKQIVDRVKGGEKLLDLGCCFGQEVRQLVSTHNPNPSIFLQVPHSITQAYDGAPSENLYGTDLRQEFIDLGYDLFQDHKTLKSTFIVADAFDPESPLKQLNGQMSIIYAGSFFHLFDWDGQFAMAKRVVELLKPEPGSMLLGRQAGNINPGEYIRAGYNGERKRWRHDPKTWKEMWELVGKETGTKWDVHAEMEELEFGKSKFVTGEMKLLKQRGEPGTKKLHFVVVRKL